MTVESQLAEVTAQRDFSRAECEELRLKLSMQQQPDSRMEQDQGRRACERQPQPPSHHDRPNGSAATEVHTGKVCITTYFASGSEGVHVCVSDCINLGSNRG